MPETIRARLIGDRPLLMHSSRLADPLDPSAIALSRLTSKRAKTTADFEEIARAEWYGGLWLAEGRPCVPPEAIESCFAAAARMRRLGKQAQAGVACVGTPLLSYRGPSDIDALWSDKNFRFRFSVQVGGSRLMRTRPRFLEWTLAIELEYLPSVMDRAVVIEILQLGGAREGLGDWRPRFGRFRVENI
jgi:hypothetical protein